MIRRRLVGVAALLLAGVVLPGAPVVAASPTSPATAPSAAVVVAAVPEACTVDAATLTWGFKESFRAYISGTIANGEWTVADGAQYETPTFSFPDGTGTWAAVQSRVSFEGAIRFTGHGDILDTTVANPVLEWSGTTGTLYLDVSGTTQEGDPVDEAAVAFAELVLPEAGTGSDPSVLDDIAVTLTEEGAAAFGTYEAGEVFDPITLDLGVLDDGAEELCGMLTPNSGPQWTVIVATVVGVAILAIAAVIVMVLRRGRASATPPA